MSNADSTIYKVVVNGDSQYSLWPAHMENAPGWRDAGKAGTKEECMAYVREARETLERGARPNEYDADPYPPWADSPAVSRKESPHASRRDVPPTVPAWNDQAQGGQPRVGGFVKCPYCGLNNALDDILCERCRMPLKQPTPSERDAVERPEQAFATAPDPDPKQPPLSGPPYDSFDSLGSFLTEALEGGDPHAASSPPEAEVVKPDEHFGRGAQLFNPGEQAAQEAPAREAERTVAAQGFTGEVRMFAGNYAPRGWALCHGQLLPIPENTALFSVIGATYGGDGKTTFALPDLRGRVPVGQGEAYHEDKNYEPGQWSGREEVYQAAQDGGRHAYVPASLVLNFIICLEGLFPPRD